MKAFPIPVVAFGPGSHDEEQLDYLPMPTDMATYRPPQLPEPEQISGLAKAAQALHAALDSLDRTANGGESVQTPLLGLPPDDIRLINQILGEGEASAIVRLPGDLEIQVQESVFAGVWRLLSWRREAGQPALLVDDVIEVGPAPTLFRAIAAEDVWSRDDWPQWQGALPPNVQSAPILLAELRDQTNRWRPGQPPHVVNLSLLPVSPEDIAFLDHHLGTGRVLMLSRGYGNCRISNTRLPNCWRVVYYNSMDKVILNTVEVVDMPEVAMAAPEDLRDSRERLGDVLAYLQA
ncbi:MAG: hydrogenase expression/formation protein [Azonexus sp.]|jgi:hydrogenase-1 operon protein HyaF|nr:hydrogenase expression/formation protein [Azonexus sp.]